MRLILALLCMLTTNFAVAGYDVHVTRKAHWSDDVGPKIALSEWRICVQGDQQITRDANNTKNDFIVTVRDEVFPLWFEPALGELRTKDPSPAAIKKLIEIAKKLKARVQGDDGEFYPAMP